MRIMKKLAALLLAAALCLSLAACGGAAQDAGEEPLAEPADSGEAAAYADAKALMDAGSYDEAIAAFEALGDYEDAADMAAQCAQLKEDQAAEDMYQGALVMLDLANEYAHASCVNHSKGEYLNIVSQYGEDVPGCKEFTDALNSDGSDELFVAKADASYKNTAFAVAYKLFEQLGDYKDSAEQLARFTVVEDVTLWYVNAFENYVSPEIITYSADGTVIVPAPPRPWAFDWEYDRFISSSVKLIYSDDGLLEKVIPFSGTEYDEEAEAEDVFNYTYDESGTLLSVEYDYTTNAGAEFSRDDFKYGESGELTQVTNSSREGTNYRFSFTYDENGLMTEASSNIGAKYTFSYDEAGALAYIALEDPVFGDQTFTFTCDDQGRPIEVIEEDSYGIFTYMYGYGDYYIYNADA